MARTTAKQKKVFKKLPKAKANYPHLNKPDTKFNPDGEYKCGMVYQLNDPLTAKIKAYFDAQVEEAEEIMAERHNCKIEELDYPYTIDEEAGTLTVKTKQKSFTWKGEKILPKPAFFDAKGKPMDGEIPYIRGGSDIAMSVEVVPYHKTEQVRGKGGKKTLHVAGITLRIRAVQIIELATGGGGNGDASMYGFEEEDGFDSEEGFESFEDDEEDTVEASQTDDLDDDDEY